MISIEWMLVSEIGKVEHLNWINSVIVKKEHEEYQILNLLLT